jgi:hypothetical protein
MRARRARVVGAVCALSVSTILAAPAVLQIDAAAAQARPENVLVAVEQPTSVPRGAVRSGPLPASTPLAIRVVLAPRNPAALSAFVAQVSSPSSPDYGHYVARGQFAKRFGPTSFAIDAVRTALSRDGLLITGLSPSHLVLSVQGTERNVAAALHTSFSTWRLGDGRHGYRVNGAVELPGSIARDVAGVVGTSSLVGEHSFAVRGNKLATHSEGLPAQVEPRQPPSECATAQQQLPQGTFTPEEEGDAYGLNVPWSHDDDGAGHTVALLEFAPYALSDIIFYDTCFGALPNGSTSDPLLHNVYVDGGTSKGSEAASDEPTLDIEEIRALAPDAQLNVYEGPNNVVGPLDTLQRIATDDTAQVVSISWGVCEQFSDHAAETPVFEQMAAQGQTVFAAAGDNGSSDCLEQSPAGGAPLVAASVDDPSSQPLVTGVGGLTVTSIDPLEQTVWNDCSGGIPGCLGDAGGGGISSVYPHPSWQAAPGVPTGSERGASHRDDPDLSVMADPNTGMLAFYQGTFQPYGGTSMGPPLMAAIAADDLQACGTTTFGFLNPLLYAMGRHGGDFDDVTTGTNAVATPTYKAKEFDAGPGYDMASGLGSPDPSTFLDALCDADATASASPATPGSSSTWLMTFHTGGDPYPGGTTVTLTAPPGTRLPSTTGDWVVDTSLGTDPPSAVALSTGPGSATENVAVLTISQGAPDVGEVTIQASQVFNPDAVGTASVGIADSIDPLHESAPLALSVPSPTLAALSVPGGHSPITAAIGSSGVDVTATVTDGSGDVVTGQPVTFETTGHAVVHDTTTTTDDAGQLHFELRDDRAEPATVTVESSGTPLGSLAVTFTDPWHTSSTTSEPHSGEVTGIASVAATGGSGFVAVARTANGHLDVARSGGARIVVSPLVATGTLPLAASDPTIARGGAWLYVAYRSTSGQLIVLSDPIHPRGHRWHIDDLTERGVVPTVIGTPDALVGGTGAHSVLSVAVVDTAHDVLRAVAPLDHVTRFATSDVSHASTWGAAAIGSVDEVSLGGAIVVFARSASGELVLLARDQGAWLADDLASDAELIGPSTIATGNPVASTDAGQATVVVPSRGGLDVFVGALGNWSASTLSRGAEGTSAPADARALPAFLGNAALLVGGSATEVVCGASTGRLVELTSLGVSDSWSAYDLTDLAHLDGPSPGAAVLPGAPTSLLAAVRGHLVVLRAVS